MEEVFLDVLPGVAFPEVPEQFPLVMLDSVPIAECTLDHVLLHAVLFRVLLSVLEVMHFVAILDVVPEPDGGVEDLLADGTLVLAAARKPLVESGIHIEGLVEIEARRLRVLCLALR